MQNALEGEEVERRIVAEVWEAFKSENFEALSQAFQGMTDEEIEVIEQDILQHKYTSTDYDPTYDMVMAMEEQDMNQSIEHYMRLETLSLIGSGQEDEDTARAMSLAATLLAAAPCVRCGQGEIFVQRAGQNGEPRSNCGVCGFGLEKETLLYIGNTARSHSQECVGQVQFGYDEEMGLLQHERDHFVHSGIGGGSSSSTASSPSCSPPQNSPLSLLKVTNLKKPKSRNKDKEKKNANNLLKTAKAAAVAAAEMAMDTTEHGVSLHPTLDMSPLALDPTLPVTFAHVSVIDPSIKNSMKSNHCSQQNKEITMTTPGTQTVTSVVPPRPPSPPSVYTTTAAKNTATRSQQHHLPASFWIASSPCLPTTPNGRDALPQRILSEPSHSPFHPCATLFLGVSGAFIPLSDRLSLLPSELFFHVLCLLDALDLTRIAQASKLCARMAGDNGVWRVKSMQHPLYSQRHVQDRQGMVSWLAYYKFLHRKSLSVKQNWAHARPQAVHVLEGHTGLISSLEMSLWTLVTASIDQTLRVWDLRTFQCTQVLHARQSLTCVAQSERAGAVCARTSFGGLCVWDIRTGELILQDDSAMPQIASFMYMDERYIGYGQCDGIVTVFDWTSRTELEVVGTYQAHEGDVIHISVLANKHVISASTNGETLVYSLPQSRIIERILLPHATQAIQFTPTIHGDKVMFSTRDAVYEYELMLDYLSTANEHGTATAFGSHGNMHTNTSRNSPDHSVVEPLVPTHKTAINLRPTPGSTLRSAPSTASGRVWKTSNSLLSQIKQRVGTINKAFDQERPIIPTRFPRLASICCVPRTARSLDHGTTSARDSYGIFMPNNCTHLSEMSVYTRTTKQVRQIHGPAVETILGDALRNRFYTTMECNQHCAVVSSGSKVYVLSFLPPDV
ncbi:hypothetical protein BGX28_008165 [Mortierella sp. GBA30]|nr:hypothetical protein BGX28_008165 [Mortierella sp. GBA30]